MFNFRSRWGRFGITLGRVATWHHFGIILAGSRDHGKIIDSALTFQDFTQFCKRYDFNLMAGLLSFVPEYITKGHHWKTNEMVRVYGAIGPDWGPDRRN